MKRDLFAINLLRHLVEEHPQWSREQIGEEYLRLYAQLNEDDDRSKYERFLAFTWGVVDRERTEAA
jgi:hypothetical protein